MTKNEPVPQSKLLGGTGLFLHDALWLLSVPRRRQHSRTVAYIRPRNCRDADDTAARSGHVVERHRLEAFARGCIAGQVVDRQADESVRAGGRGRAPMKDAVVLESLGDGQPRTLAVDGIIKIDRFGMQVFVLGGPGDVQSAVIPAGERLRLQKNNSSRCPTAGSLENAFRTRSPNGPPWNTNPVSRRSTGLRPSFGRSAGPF